MITRFRNRREAGQVLTQELAAYVDKKDVIVLGLARGGVVVAAEVAKRLRVPLDVLVVRKLGTPGQPELAMGAIAPGGIYVLTEEVMDKRPVSQGEFNAVLEQETRELTRREKLYRRQLPPLDVQGKTVIVVDDGLATGSTMRAAIASLRRLHPAHLVAAVPVGAAEACQELRPLVDEFVCPLIPPSFHAIGLWYQEFSQSSDNEVCRLLEKGVGPVTPLR